MDEMMSYRLQLVFLNSGGTTNMMNPKFFKETLAKDTQALQLWMMKFSDLNMFHDAERGIDLYTEKKSARLVETKVTTLF